MKNKTHEKSEPWVNVHGEFVDGKFVYYEFLEDENGDWIKDKKYSFRFVDEKYHQYTTLIVTPKVLEILVNETGLTDFELKKYISTNFFKEEKCSAPVKILINSGNQLLSVSWLYKLY